MITINRRQVDTLSKQQNSKQVLGKNDTVLYPIFAHSLINADDTIKEFSTYEMAHWTNYADRWVSNRTSHPNTTGYPRGTIVYVDLGAGNFGHEPSFSHPGIVLDQNRDSILLAPCSSKKYGKGFPEVVDATISDGFSTNTGVQTKSIRWLSKNRVISKIGTTSTRVLDCIDTLVLKSIPLYTREILDKDNIIAVLEAEKNFLENDNKNLQAEIERLKSLVDNATNAAELK